MSDATPKMPTPFQRSVCWVALSSISLLVILLLVAGLVYGITWVFMTLEAIFLPLVIAGVLAYLLFPLVTMTQKLIKRRALAVLVVMLSFVGVFVSLIATVVPPLLSQTNELLEKRMAIYQSAVQTGKHLLEKPLVQRGVDMLYEKVEERAEDDGAAGTRRDSAALELSYPQKLAEILNYNASFMVSKAVGYLTAGSRAISGTAALIFGLVMVPVFLFYFLLESDRIKQNWHTLLPLRHSRFRYEVVETLSEINSYIVAFVRGQMLVSLINGALLGVSLKIMGLPYAITIAVVASVLGIIPYIGTVLTSVPALLIAWFTWHDPAYLIAVAAVFVVVNQLESWVIQPRVIGDSVGMHDMTVMFSVLFWSLVFGGVIGALLAVPLTASLKVLFSRYIWTSITSRDVPMSEQQMEKKPRRRRRASSPDRAASHKA